MSYPRDLIGYGANPPHPKWKDDAKIALQIVLNYEEGSEYSIPDRVWICRRLDIANHWIEHHSPH